MGIIGRIQRIRSFGRSVGGYRSPFQMWRVLHVTLLPHVRNWHCGSCRRRGFVARALVSDLGVIFAIKLNDFLTNLFPSISKVLERLLRQKNSPSTRHPIGEIKQVQEVW